MANMFLLGCCHCEIWVSHAWQVLLWTLRAKQPRSMDVRISLISAVPSADDWWIVGIETEVASVKGSVKNSTRPFWVWATESSFGRKRLLCTKFMENCGNTGCKMSSENLAQGSWGMSGPGRTRQCRKPEDKWQKGSTFGNSWRSPGNGRSGCTLRVGSPCSLPFCDALFVSLQENQNSLKYVC